MTEQTTTATETPASTAAVPTPPATPTPTPPPATTAPAKFTPEQQAAIDSLINERLQRAQAAADAKIADAEAKAEKVAVTAIIARAAAGTHNPDVVARLVDTDGLTSTDPAAIEAKVAAFLTENPYLVKGDTAPAKPTTTPGAASTASAGGKLLTETEMNAISPQQLAKDEALMKLYTDSLNALDRTA